jgi:uncharacterized protein (DUF885 family)
MAPHDARALAEEFQHASLQAAPFTASMYGIPGHDADVPDASEAGDAAWHRVLETTLDAAAAHAATSLPAADTITLDTLVDTAQREQLTLDSRAVEHTVTAMPFSGPAVLFAVAALTVIADRDAASDYVERLRRSGGWLDQVTQRLRTGAAQGRLPVAPLVDQAVRWADSLLEQEVPESLTAPQPPAAWDGVSAWREDVAAVARDVVKPAMARWRALLVELRPLSRDGDRAGLAHLPGGAEDYARAIRMHTTLPLTAEQLHQTGLDHIERLESQARELGAQLGIDTFAGISAALRQASAELTPEAAIRAATDAVRRSEARAPEVFPRPLPPPCAVAAMPSVVAASGMAPHYTPPRLDGSRPGTYWFNTERPTAGTGWDIEAVAFHEAVPGHHLQLSRIQLLADLPSLQRQRSITVFSEGWGLYAEQLAGEMGLYSDARQQLGAVSNSLMRAARLVVDTGLHAFGWSRRRAGEFFTQHVPMPADFLAAEIDRYIVEPGQALAYLTGKLEILRLRDEAQRRLGPQFSLSAFHAAVLDSGSLPMPVLERTIRVWAGDSGSAPTGR